MLDNNPTYKDLEVVPNEYNKRDYVIKVSIPEFNCVCPRTSLPDFGCINIEYTPNKHIVELKSLKLYIVKFRNLGIGFLQRSYTFYSCTTWNVNHL